METKTCKTCNETKDISDYRPRGAVCNTCYNKQWLLKYGDRRKTPEQIEKHTRNKKLASLDLKFCNHCQKALPLLNFTKNRGHMCKLCRNSINKTYTRNKSLVGITNRKAWLKRRDLIDDTYVRCNIKKMIYKISNVQIKSSEIPQDFIDLKRKELTLKRKIENGNKKNQGG